MAKISTDRNIHSVDLYFPGIMDDEQKLIESVFDPATLNSLCLKLCLESPFFFKSKSFI